MITDRSGRFSGAWSRDRLFIVINFPVPSACFGP